MSYVDEVLEKVKKRDADQPEFLQAVTEVLETLKPVIEQDEETVAAYEKRYQVFKFIRDHWWLILIIVAAVAAASVLIHRRRKKAVKKDV